MLISDEPPHGLAGDEVMVRRRIVQGYACTFLQEFNNADQYFRQAVDLALINHIPLIAEVELGKGTLAVLKRDYLNANALYQEALLKARANRNDFVEANALGNLGWSAMRQEHYAEAIDWFTSALALSQERDNQTQTEKTLGNLGWCYYQIGDFERALQNFEEAEKASVKLGLPGDQLKWLNNVGLIHHQRRRYSLADSYYQRALEIAKKLESKTETSMALNNLAASALERESYDDAEKYNRESLNQQSVSTGPPTNVDPFYLDSLLNESRIERGRKNYLASTLALQKVIQFSGENVSQRWEAQSELATVYALQGQNEKANAQFQKALQTIDAARESLGHEEYQLSFLSVATRFYNDYIDFLVSHGRAREALAVAEHSRARTLAEGLKVPVSQLSGAAFHPEENARKLNSAVLSYWLKPDRSYLWVVTPTKVALFPLAGQDEIDATVQQYRKALLGPRPDTASAPGQRLYELLVAPAVGLLDTRCPTSAAVSRRGHHEPLDIPKTTGCGSNAPRVIVIGDGSLLSLNFETLLVPSPQPHYWIEDATIANASSIALLGTGTKVATASSTTGRHGKFQHVGHPQSLPTGQTLLLIGDPTYAGSEYPQLTQAKLEVQKVESYFPEQSRVVIQGKNATPGAYAVTKPFQYNFIHFVAHGTASRVSPLDSSIVLSKEGDAYKLYARDIMTQPLKAQLVTISACYGAGNRAYSGEGLVGLSWAFLRAGAHNVIAALWEVNDASTPQLMGNLYLNVQNGQDPATALRAAKLAMLHSENVFRRPFYWGAFQLYIGS